jgi:hypothetical protein
VQLIISSEQDSEFQLNQADTYYVIGTYHESILLTVTPSLVGCYGIADYHPLRGMNGYDNLPGNLPSNIPGNCDYRVILATVNQGGGVSHNRNLVIYEMEGVQ